MRKVKAALFISLDGVVEAPFLWSFEHFDEDMEVVLSKEISTTDAVLMGRVTYDEWAPYWPTATDEPFASFINKAPKYVVSTTLKNVDAWQNSTLIKTDVVEKIREMKQQPGKDIAITGSPTLVWFALQNGLLDELTLTIYPVIAGSGKHLFRDGDALQRLKLTNSKMSRTGVAILTYQPRENE